MLIIYNNLSKVNKINRRKLNLKPFIQFKSFTFSFRLLELNYKLFEKAMKIYNKENQN